MITSTTGTSGAGPATSLNGGRAATTLGRNEFLKLLVAQLRNQDPLSPLQPHEFAAQLAQFSSVEQLSQLNDAVSEQSVATQMAALIGKTSLGASLLGRQIVAAGDQVEIVAGSAASVRADVGLEGGTATLRLLDSSGREVASRDLGPVKGGLQTLTLPDDLPAGVYTYALEVKDRSGNAVPVTQYTLGTVQGMNFEDGLIMLRLGGISVPLDALAEVDPAATIAAH